MAATVLLYGADEFIGRLVAQRAVSTWLSPGAPNLVLAGRSLPLLLELGAELNATTRTFNWADPAALAAALVDCDVIVNACSPFEKTSDVIAHAAVQAGKRYLDVNSEIDVEAKLFDLDGAASQAQATVVCAGGPSAVISNLMVRVAIKELYATGVIAAGRPIGTIRLAVSCVAAISRSSAASVWRSLSHGVAVGRVAPGPPLNPALRVQYVSVPIGQMERTFDFGVGSQPAGTKICSGVSIADSFAAGLAALGEQTEVHRIETYSESSTASRVLYPLGAGVRAFLSPAYTFDATATATQFAFETWPPGPVSAVRALEPFKMVLQIEDEFGTLVVDWRLSGANVYEMVAALSAAMALRLCVGASPGLAMPSSLLVATMAGAQPIQDLANVKIDRKVLA